MNFFDTLADICLLIILCICYTLIAPFYAIETLIDHLTGHDKLTEKDRYYQRYL